MKNAILFTFTVLLLGSSSKNVVEEQLLNSELIKKNFTEADLPNLAKMIEFADSLVLINRKNPDISDAYHAFLDSIYIEYVNKGNWFSLDSKSVYPFLLSLDSVTFNKIWRVNTSYKRLRYKDSIYINPTNFMHIGFKRMGSFFDFTNDLASINNNYREVNEMMKGLGDISPTAWMYLLKENKMFNYNNIDERFWISVNLLRCTNTTRIETLKE